MKIENDSEKEVEFGQTRIANVSTAKTNEHWLHFIGRGLYKQTVFEREAQKLGVQRAIPFKMLKSMDYGIPILLAYHIRDQDRRYKDRRKISKGTGEIFGYFNIEALVHNLPDEIRKDLMIRLDCDCSSIPPEKGNISRACGSYSIVAICQCRNSWFEIVHRIEQTCKKHKADPSKFKYFVKGSYIAFRSSMILKPITFSRGFQKVKIEGLDRRELEENARDIKNLVWILDYERRSYLKKKDRRALENRSLKEC